MNNTRYVIIFVLIMTVLAALMLAGTLQVTKAKAAENEAIFNKRAILMALGKNLTADGKTAADMTDAQVLDIFNKQVEQVVVDQQGKSVDGVMAEKWILLLSVRNQRISDYFPSLFLVGIRRSFTFLLFAEMVCGMKSGAI